MNKEKVKYPDVPILCYFEGSISLLCKICMILLLRITENHMSDLSKNMFGMGSSSLLITFL